MNYPPRRRNVVYSTDPDPEPEPLPVDPGPPPNKQTARIWRDSRRRKGKTMTVIANLQHDPAILEELMKTLKKFCGAGGTLKDGEIEIQGDHREKIAEKLKEMGYKVKFVGG